MPLDYLIIGQGLAGTLFAHFAIQAGKRILVVDDHLHHSASMAAAGLINPITGRYFVKSWLIDDLLPMAIRTYTDLETVTGHRPLFTPKKIIRSLFHPTDEQHWWLRATREGYATYMSAIQNGEAGDFAGMIRPAHDYGTVTGGGRLDVPALLTAFRTLLHRQQAILEAPFSHADLQLNEQGATYQHWQTRMVVFCEGYQVRHNPYFAHLPFDPAKGEALLIRLPHHQPADILKHQLFIIPLADGTYWVGANYEKQPADPTPTPKGYNWLTAKLDKVLAVPYEIVGHQAGIRPATRHRRPLIGRHPQHPQLVLFNGLGTKGSSLAPYFAHALFAHLEQGTPLSPEVTF